MLAEQTQQAICSTGITKLADMLNQLKQICFQFLLCAPISRKQRASTRLMVNFYGMHVV